MKVVIDANEVISALIKRGLTRNIILNKYFEFVAPSFIFSEIYKYKKEICKKAKISFEDFDILLDKLFRYIKIINLNYYSDMLEEAKNLIEDIYDVPYLACAIYLDCPIWSDDRHFKMQNVVKVFNTGEMVELLND